MSIVKGESIVREYLVKEQDGRLHSDLFVLKRICCRSENCGSSFLWVKKAVLLKQRILYLQPVLLFLPFSCLTYTASLGNRQLFGDEILFAYTLRRGNLQESERKKNKAEEQKKQYKDRASRAAQRMENLGESVSQMYGNAGCDSAVLQDLTGSSEVSSGNLMQCLGLLEQRVEELSSTLILTHNQVSY